MARETAPVIEQWAIGATVEGDAFEACCCVCAVVSVLAPVRNWGPDGTPAISMWRR